MRVSVSNKQQYAILRGGHTFPAGQTIEIDVSTTKRLAEIKACVYLKVALIEEPEPESPTIVDTPPSTEPVEELTIKQALESKTKKELIADFPDLGLSERQGKDEMIAAILAALADETGEAA